MSSNPTGSYVQGGRLYLSTAFMMLCNTTADAARMASLPRFMAEQKEKYNTTVDFLFGQSRSNENAAGLGLWLTKALETIHNLPYNIPKPVLRFDIEYDPHPTDMYRVLRQAAYVRATVNGKYPDPNHRPLIAWAVDFASLLPLSTSYAPCPAAGANNATMLGGECFLRIVDHIDLMDYRSYALQSPDGHNCDGSVRFAIPFFKAAKALNRTVAVGFESNCGLGAYTYKISYCSGALQDKWNIRRALPYMYSQMEETAMFLQNTTKAVEKYPCAKTAIPDLPAVQPGHDYWTGVASPQPLVVEDVFGWNNLAFNHTSFAPINCEAPRDSWQVCVPPTVAATSPTFDMF